MTGRLDGRVAVITGASTGIGAACARLLDRAGYTVFAGVRRQADGERLQREASARLLPLLLDVTDGEQIAAAAEVAPVVQPRRSASGRTLMVRGRSGSLSSGRSVRSSPPRRARTASPGNRTRRGLPVQAARVVQAARASVASLPAPPLNRPGSGVHLLDREGGSHADEVRRGDQPGPRSAQPRRCGSRLRR